MSIETIKETASVILQDSVPVWAVVGIVACGGWLFEITREDDRVMNAILSAHGERLAALETGLQAQAESDRRVEAYLQRIEDYLRNNPTGD